MQPIIIPTVVLIRWREAHQNPSMARWSSLTQMLSSMVVNGSLYSPGSPVVDDLRTLAHIAHFHQLALQPAREEVAA